MKNNKFIKVSIILLCFLIVILCVVFFSFKILNKNIDNDDSDGNSDENMESSEVFIKEIQIVDVNNKERPYAVMINNHEAARPQAGLDKAYLVYELMVEGGITRFMALYESDVTLDKVGSIRSSRHNYLDYVLENDAIYVHWGYSTYAKDDIVNLNIDNINGLIYGNKYFVTDTTLNRSIEHTRFTSSDLMKKATSDLGYRTNRNNDYLLNYTTDEVLLSELENSKIANEISIKFSNYVTASYRYNSDDKYYYRSINGVNHTDLVTGSQYKFKNIIVYAVKYNTISSLGHQDLNNIGTGDGYYITNGYATAIKWTKNDRSSQTVYSYLDGREIEVSDGNTFIEIYPTTGNLVIN